MTEGEKGDVEYISEIRKFVGENPAISVLLPIPILIEIFWYSWILGISVIVFVAFVGFGRILKFEQIQIFGELFLQNLLDSKRASESLHFSVRWAAAGFIGAFFFNLLLADLSELDTLKIGLYLIVILAFVELVIGAAEEANDQFETIMAEKSEQEN